MWVAGRVGLCDFCNAPEFFWAGHSGAQIF
jgi:hypothetical protein